MRAGLANGPHPLVGFAVIVKKMLVQRQGLAVPDASDVDGELALDPPKTVFEQAPGFGMAIEIIFQNKARFAGGEIGRLHGGASRQQQDPSEQGDSSHGVILRGEALG